MRSLAALLLTAAVLLGGCVSVPAPGTPSTPAPAAEPAALPPAPPASANAAVVALVDDARAQQSAGRHDNAAAAIERALRIEPRNPALWQQLARVRYDEGNFAQAESLAARSNAWAGKNNRLRAENWRLIAEARSRRGNERGAQAALEQAARFER